MKQYDMITLILSYLLRSDWKTLHFKLKWFSASRSSVKGVWNPRFVKLMRPVVSFLNQIYTINLHNFRRLVHWLLRFLKYGPPTSLYLRFWPFTERLGHPFSVTNRITEVLPYIYEYYKNSYEIYLPDYIS